MPRAILRCAPEFLEQSHVLDGDDGLIGEGFKQLDLLVRERTDFRRRIRIAPIGTSSREAAAPLEPSGFPYSAVSYTASGNSVFSVREQDHGYGSVFRSTNSSTGRQSHSLIDIVSRRFGSASARKCAASPAITFDTTGSRIVCARRTAPHLRDRIQHRLNISWRTGDHAKDFARRRLLLQRFLEFVEQPHVLDGDDRLVGEGLKSLICAGVKGRTSMRRAFSVPMSSPC